MRGAIAVWVMLGFLSPALAQDESRYERARQQASEAFSAGQFEEAAGLFQQAFEASPKGNLLYNIGLCYEKAGNNAQAVAFYQRFVEAMPASPKRPAVQRRIVELRETLKGNMVTLDVSSDPPGAIVFVDDKAKGALGNTPVSVDLLPGEYAVIVELKGYEPTTQRVTLTEGRGERVNVSLVPQGQVGSVTLLVTERGANIMIDKKKVGTSPLTEPVRLRAGTHEIMVMKPGFAAWKKDVEVAAKSEQNVRVSLEPEGGGLVAGGGGGDAGGSTRGGNIWPWVVVGAGAAAIGGGVFTGLSAQSLYDQLDEKRKNEELVAASDIDAGNSLVLTTNVLLGVGSAAVIGGVVWWLMDDSGVETEGSLSGTFGVGPGGPSVGLQGSF
ncbi:MAG: PEGA domain-containing protein [bacterium]